MGRPGYILGQFGKRVGGSKVNLFVIKITASGIGHLLCKFALAWWQHVLSLAADKSNRSVSFARWQQGAGFVVPRTTAC